MRIGMNRVGLSLASDKHILDVLFIYQLIKWKSSRYDRRTKAEMRGSNQGEKKVRALQKIRVYIFFHMGLSGA